MLISHATPNLPGGSGDANRSASAVQRLSLLARRQLGAAVHHVFGNQDGARPCRARDSERESRPRGRVGLTPHPDWTEDVSAASRAVWDIVEADTSTALPLVELTTTAPRDPAP